MLYQALDIPPEPAQPMNKRSTGQNCPVYNESIDYIFTCEKEVTI